MEYKDFFSPKTLSKLNKKSAENLKDMLGNENLMQTMMSSQRLLSQVIRAEAPYKEQLEKLAVDMVNELYPILKAEGIVLDAKIASMSDVGQELDESISPESRRRIINSITQGAALRGAFAFYLFKEHLDDLDPSLVESYNQIMKKVFGVYDDENAIAMFLSMLAQGQKMAGGSSKVIMKEIQVNKPNSYFTILMDPEDDEEYGGYPTGKITQPQYLQNLEFDHIGDFYQTFFNDVTLFKDLYDSLIGYLEHKQIPYDLRRSKNGSMVWIYIPSKFFNQENTTQINEADSGITIKARAICFPMLVHELIKGLYELISLQGFKGDKAANQAVVDKVDLLKNEPSDIRYGKFIFDALNNAFIDSGLSDDLRTREFFFQEVYQLDDDDFISFIENAVNEELTASQQKWVKDTLRDIIADLKADDFSATGLDEIVVRTPGGISLEKLDKLESDIKSARSLRAQQEIAIKVADIVLPLYKKSNPDRDDSAAVKAIRAAKNYLEDPSEFNRKAAKMANINAQKDSYTDPTSIAANVSILITGVINAALTQGEELPKLIIIDIFKFARNIAKKSKEITDKQMNDKLDEIVVKTPGSKIKNISSLPVLDLKIGKYDVSKGRVGTEVSFYGKNVDIRTRTRISKVFDKLGIKPEKTWVGWIKNDDNSIASMRSTFVLSYYKGEPILIAQTQTRDPQAGQTYIYSKYFKSGKALRLPDPDPEIKNIDDSSVFADSNATKEQILQALKINDNDEPEQLNEYSDKVIKATLDRWKDEKGYNENISKQLIQRFDQIKSSLAQRLDIVVLPDELKKSNKYLDINQYSFEDMVKLIASIPENPEKAKKEAIKKFVEKEGIDRNTAQSYVARFMTKRDDLKFAGQEGSDISKEDLDEFVPKRLLINNAYLDARNWTWESFEQMMDALFPAAGKSVEGEENTVSTDADKVYDKDGIEIYKGDDVHKCISYNPVEQGSKKYGWCVTQIGNTNYDYYRFKEESPTFYFVFDRSKTSEGTRGSFKDQWHAFVVQITADGTTYIVTGADNRGDIRANGWEGIAKIVPPDTWNKIKNLKDYFKPIALSAVERGRKFASGKNLSLDEFKELTQDEKILYIQGKASKNAITPDILAILPKYKINLEGRSTTLANIAIDSGQKFNYSALKDNEALAKRYAIFRFRHTNYSADPIPLPFVKYLDDDAKKKYADTFDQYLTYEYLDKFFGGKVTEDYVNKQVKNLDFLPKEAAKYIKDPKLKQLFEIYSKLFDSWEYEANTNIDDEKLENLADMPEQQIDPRPMLYSQWTGLSTAERKNIITLAEKYNQNSEYATLIWGLPFIIKDGSNTYALLPIDQERSTLYPKWVLSDVNGKIVKNLSGKSTLNGNSIEGGYADVERSYQRVYGMNDLKIVDSNLKETISKDLTKFFVKKTSW